MRALRRHGSCRREFEIDAEGIKKAALSQQGSGRGWGIIPGPRGEAEMRAVVAQLDRATGYELVGWGFESLRPHQCVAASAGGVLRCGARFAGERE